MDNIGPPLSHDRLAAHVDLIRWRFVFIELCKRTVNNQVTPPPYFQTNVDIGKRIRQAFIEAPNLLKNITPRQHARRRDCAAVTRELSLKLRRMTVDNKKAPGLEFPANDPRKIRTNGMDGR